MSNTNYIRTTAVIDETSSTLLKKSGIVSEYQRNKTITLILKAVLSKYNSENKVVLGTTVKYQKQLVNVNIIHYEIESNIYEACLDLRKSTKLSVSKMINEGIKEFLCRILSSDTRQKDKNYNNLDSNFHYLDNYPIEYKFTATYNYQKSIHTTIINVKAPPPIIQTISLHFHHDSFT